MARLTKEECAAAYTALAMAQVDEAGRVLAATEAEIADPTTGSAELGGSTTVEVDVAQVTSTAEEAEFADFMKEKADFAGFLASNLCAATFCASNFATAASNINTKGAQHVTSTPKNLLHVPQYITCSSTCYERNEKRLQTLPRVNHPWGIMEFREGLSTPGKGAH